MAPSLAMKIIKNLLEKIFNLIFPILKPEFIQHMLRRMGFKFPYYRFAEKLDYRGIVDFEVNGKILYMRSHNGPIEMFIFWYGIFGYWESVQLKLWSKLVLIADVICDVGANNGVYSLIASTNVKAKVYSFEPVPLVKEMLDQNVELNQLSNIETSNLVVGDAEKVVNLYIPREGWVDVASINKQFAEQALSVNHSRALECQMTSLDSFFDKKVAKTPKRILLKIDVEGVEAIVLKGMQNLLINHNTFFQVEILTPASFNELRTLIPSWYVVRAIDEEKKRISLTNDYIQGVSNYLIYPESLESEIQKVISEIKIKMV